VEIADFIGYLLCKSHFMGREHHSHAFAFKVAHGAENFIDENWI
jgi:hypothetical protein